MSADYFLDSNVFVYLFDETDNHKRMCAENLVRKALEGRNGCISYQVVQETLNVLTGKLNAAPGQVRRLFEHVLLPLWQVNPSVSLYHRGLDLQSRYGYGFYDSLIIAAALESGCEILYTEDLRQDQKIDDLTIRNPFAN
ncbi:MAG: PIN domain-containing protein [Gemmatimonadetes bacterium]|nr:PIN domain-containing protein [Gemmatimonadota bacterium]